MSLFVRFDLCFVCVFLAGHCFFPALSVGFVRVLMFFFRQREGIVVDNDVEWKPVIRKEAAAAALAASVASSAASAPKGKK